MHQAIRSFRLSAAAAALMLLLAPAYAEAQTKVKSGFNMFSPEQDVEIGRQSASEVQRQMPLVNDNALQSYVDTLGRRIAASAPGPKFPYQFRVVNASDLNAFALPGGYIYLNRGIIEAARNEGEIAGVLAHEISHVALRHGTHNASKAYMTQAGLGILGGILGGKIGSNTAQIINVLGGFGLNALFLKYSREAETDADILGSQMLVKAGYNPQDMVSFFQTIEKQETRKVANWMSSHPAPSKRISRIQKEAGILGVPLQASSSSSQLASIQAGLRRQAPAPTTQQIAQGQQPGTSTGSSRGRVSAPGSVEAPSRSLETYTNRNGIFQVRYPANWGVADEGPTGVTIAPRNGVVRTSNGGNEIIYGAIISHFESHETSRPTMEEATDDLLEAVRRTSPHLGVVRGSGQRFQLAGGTGLGVTLRGNNPQTGLTERVTLVTRQLGDGHLLYFLFIAPDRDAKALAPTLNAMVNSLRVDDRRGH
jgi:Zn-dependent protease with chaperone function